MLAASPLSAVSQLSAASSFEAVAEEHALLDGLFDALFPLARSITGEGLRQSYAFLASELPLEIETVPSGTRVFDWDVPPEWRLRRARLTGPNGIVYCDASRSNLEVVNYASPIDCHLSREELEPHLHSLPHLPDAVPYVTSYYKRQWGFCLSDRARRAMPSGTYHVCIDSDFVAGGVPFGQVVLPGESSAEVLLTSYLCHPSMANNELSGPLALLALYRRIVRWPRRRFTYRFVLHPETIGSLCFLHRWGSHLQRHLVAGLVLTCLGGPATRLSYKQSRRGDTLLDQLVTSRGAEFAVRAFDPTGGSDERQHCAPGFNLPVGQFGRTLYGQYEGYHTSLDTKAFMGIDQVVASAASLESLLLDLELAAEFENLAPFGEPQLGRRGLYPTMNADQTRTASADGVADSRWFLNQLLTVLSASDGEQSMLGISHRTGVPLPALRPVVERLEAEGLLRFSPRLPRYLHPLP